MSVTIRADTPPIRLDASGALRVGQSRVLLELVIRAFHDGATPENIVQRYPSTTLADVYGVVAYYLRHPGDVETYMAEREIRGEGLRQRVESRQGDLQDLRRRLLARRGA
jgi:uncharacterized protein (DUF433 family)